MAEKIKITFLGTASAIPTARRNHTAVLLSYKDENILFDCGEGTQRQFRKAKLSVCKLTRIVISHWHADHVLGIPGLLQSMIMNGYTRSLKIYGPKGTKTHLKSLIDLFGINPKSLRLEVHETKDENFIEENEFYLTASSMKHNAPTNAYAFIVKEKNRLNKEKLKKLKLPNSPIIGKLTRGETVTVNGKKIDGKKLLYKEPMKKVTLVIDTKYTEDATKLAKNSDLLICEASHSKEEAALAKEHFHMTSKDAATIAKKAKAKKLALIHLSQKYDMIPKAIQKEAKEIFKETVVAEDLDSIEI